MKQSPIYETNPVNMPGARKFLNAVLLAETRLSPEACLHAFRAIEVRLGRPTRHPRYAPRTLDLDLLLYGRVVRRSSHGPAVPHPEMHRRAFVLVPLADIAPNLAHPVLHRRISTLLREIPREGVRRWLNN